MLITLPTKQNKNLLIQLMLMKVFSNISEIDLVNLSINTKNSDFSAFTVKNDSSETYNVLYTSADDESLKNIKRKNMLNPIFDLRCFKTC